MKARIAAAVRKTFEIAVSVCPGYLQFINVGFIDLGEWRVSCAALITTIVEPSRFIFGLIFCSQAKGSAQQQ